MSEYIYTTEGAFGLRECTGEKIVRCKDCKRMREWTADELAGYDEAELADRWCVFFRIGTYDDFFCAWGERRQP